MNNIENRSRKLDESIRNSLKDSEAFQYFIKEEVNETVNKVSLILKNQEQCIEILKSRINEGTLTVQRLEGICNELQVKLNEMNERFNVDYNEFTKKSRELDKLAAVDFMKHLKECEDLNRLLNILKITICLFINITKIKWDDIAGEDVRGTTLKENRAIRFDIKKNSKFEAIDELWGILG